jgi:hypothetical protein
MKVVNIQYDFTIIIYLLDVHSQLIPITHEKLKQKHENMLLLTLII